jgi:hypothetical protein
VPTPKSTIAPDPESLEAIAEKAAEPVVEAYPKDKKTYDPTKPHEIDGVAGKIFVTRGNLNTQRMVGKAVASALGGMTVDNRTYETTWMSIMLQFLTQTPGSLPSYCNGSIDKFIENIYEFDDLLHYYKAWEDWRNSFRSGN